jgi:4-hydroxy-tetrahydrodipicolinate synthase
MFAGTYTALVTPFRDDRIDEPAFERLIEAQIEAGIDGIVPVGTTGESPTLDHAEHHRVIELAVQIAKKRCKVIAGTGSNATSEAVSLTLEAERLGADAALLVAPYYNKPSQEGLFQHYRAIATASKLPLVLYSIPGRCGIEIGVETVVRLAKECPTVVAIKEAGGTVERVSALRAVLPDSFDILSGDDSLTVPFIAAGAVGVISVATNRIPGVVSAMVKAALNGNFQEARRLHRQYYSLYKDLFIEPNPVPIKYALARMGWMTPDVRLPLCPMGDASRAKLDATLKALDLLPA